MSIHCEYQSTNGVIISSTKLIIFDIPNALISSIEWFASDRSPGIFPLKLTSDVVLGTVTQFLASVQLPLRGSFSDVSACPRLRTSPTCQTGGVQVPVLVGRHSGQCLEIRQTHREVSSHDFESSLAEILEQRKTSKAMHERDHSLTSLSTRSVTI